MSGLPSGTVSLLFSDIEGSTALLKRLGAAYAEVLNGQRQVLRQAWADHDGVEMGTEGDSFFVVFPTAEGAVAAATQAQRNLSESEWPAGEQVLVRIGIHTGSPTINDGGYVGMDVHRAARIAGSAHGGQVVLSAATVELVADCLPEHAGVKDLGSHQLKDITYPEHLFQLTIRGLQTEFPPIKTLGASSSLPRPATPLVGRDGELAELTALLSSPQVRLVTLTGPGGSGKTRLAIGVAEGLVDRFPDGVYFVPLAAVATADVMWTTIAEVLDVPPEGRIPPGFFDHVAHRTALFVLDNLEQINNADTVVADLLQHAQQVVVIASSRRQLNVPGEHVHAVPPLELPVDATLAAAEASGAVQLFAQHARMAKASFKLTPATIADVVDICRRLDGLPLAIELAAARIRLLSPAALLARLDKALDLASTSSLAAARQKTLRDTIAWSYDLLNPTQQSFFQRLGVFAGSADLDAVAAVIGDLLDDTDPLDLVADLVDASLITITEDEAGEPRIGMLETIRTYALDQLTAWGDLNETRWAHGKYFLTVVKDLDQMVLGAQDQALAAGRRFALEHDNVREALTWTLRSDEVARSTARMHLGLDICGGAHRLWRLGGYLVEARGWLERAVTMAGGADSPALGRCLTALAYVDILTGDAGAALPAAERSVALWRGQDDLIELARALDHLGMCQMHLDDRPAARSSFEEALAIASDAGADRRLSSIYSDLSRLEALDEHFERAVDLMQSALEVDRRLGCDTDALIDRLNLACLKRYSGRSDLALEDFRALLPEALRLSSPDNLIINAEDVAAVLAELGHHEAAARLLGAAEATRERVRVPRDPLQQGEMEQPMSVARAALGPDVWNAAYDAGRNLSVEDALTEAHAATASATV